MQPIEENANELLDTDDTIKFTTITTQECRFNARKEIQIFPSDELWSFTHLMIFVNELEDFHIDEKNNGRLRDSNTGCPYIFFRFISNSNPNEIVYINIDVRINVRVTKPFIKKWQDENVYKKNWTCKSSIIYLKPSSRAIKRNSSLMFFSEECFSSVMSHFIHSFVSMKVAIKADETVMIYEYHDRFISQFTNDLINFEMIKKSCKGFLLLYVSKFNNTRYKLDKIHINGEKQCILAGTYVSPHASCLVTNINVKGIMLDTTWSLFQNYVTFFPTLIIKNVGIPIGFCFGIHENAEIYNNFFTVFQDIYGYSITDFISLAETDQGVALKAAVEQQGMNHLVCLRHLLVSLGTSKFASQVGNLVKATCEKDYKMLKEMYELSWVGISPQDNAKLVKLLNKVGLCYLDGSIEIFDEDRWIECSMIHRSRFQMPSCTNQLESAHGHMNALIPRRNCFWSSLKRLIDETDKRTQNFKSNFTRNYQSYKRKINRIIKLTPNDQLKATISYYETDIMSKTCQCGESSLISSMMEVALPCSHLHHLGMPFPELNPPEIVLNGSIPDELFYEIKEVSSENVANNFGYYEKVREYVYKVIKRYSHCKKKDKDTVKSFVEEKLPFKSTPEKYVLGYPAEIFQVIDEGIRYFYREKKKI